MFSLELIFNPSNVDLVLDLTNQRVLKCVLELPRISRKRNKRVYTSSHYGWSLIGYEPIVGDDCCNPTIQQLRDLGFDTRPFAEFELTGDTAIRLIHLEECFPSGVATVRKLEFDAQAAMARFGASMAKLCGDVSELSLGVSPHCPIYAAPLSIADRIRLAETLPETEMTRGKPSANTKKNKERKRAK